MRWQAVRIRGSPLHLAGASFPGRVPFHPGQTVPKQLSSDQGENLSRSLVHQPVFSQKKKEKKTGKTPLPLSGVTACPQPRVPWPCSCSNAGNLLLSFCPFSWGHSLPLPDLLPFFPSLLSFLSGLLLLLFQNLLLPGLVCWP